MGGNSAMVVGGIDAPEYDGFLMIALLLSMLVKEF